MRTRDGPEEIYNFFLFKTPNPSADGGLRVLIRNDLGLNKFQ